MNETLNKDELSRLAMLGSEDSNEPAPTSIFTSLAATFTVCTTAGWASAASSLSVVIGISKRWC